MASVTCKVDLTVSVLSTEYVKVPIRATVNGAPYDPTADVVDFAIVIHNATPGVGDWNTGGWETTTQGEHLARVLIGPAALALPTGFYDVYVKVVDNPETPVLLAGVLRIE